MAHLCAQEKHQMQIAEWWLTGCQFELVSRRPMAALGQKRSFVLAPAGTPLYRQRFFAASAVLWACLPGVRVRFSRSDALESIECSVAPLVQTTDTLPAHEP